MCNPNHLMKLSDCVGFFPGTVSVQTIRNRIKEGVDGVHLKAEFDGSRWWCCKEWVEEFIEQVTQQRLKRQKRRLPPTQVDLLMENYFKRNK